MNHRPAVPSAKILVVDRNGFWTQWATQILRDDGYEVQSLSSLEEAIDLVEGDNFDLVVVGADIARRRTTTISKLAKRSKDPMHFLVVYPVRPSYLMLRLLWKAGASEIQLKPYDRDDLLAMIASELQMEENAHWNLNQHRATSAYVGNC